jgi:CheY-like chemotaxis protein
MGREYTVTRASDPLDLVARLQRGAYETVCLYFHRDGAEDVLQVCRTARSLTSGALILLSEGRLRSADRARGLEAGADDVVSQEVNIRELESRFRRAGAVRDRGSALDESATATPEPIEEVLDGPAFAEALKARLQSPRFSYFTLVHVAPGASEEVARALRESIRAEAGDFVGTLDGGYGVVLQDARIQHAEAFVRRLHEALGGTAELVTEYLSSPDEAERIRALVAG